VRVEEFVGQRVRARREELGMTQEEFGRLVGRLVGRNWSRSTVSVAEKGGRAWTAAELVAASAVLRATVGDLLRPPLQQGDAVELGGPEALPSDVLFDLVTSRLPEDLNFAAIQETLRLLAASAARSKEDSARELDLAHELDRLLMQRVAAGGVVRAPLAGPGVDPSSPFYGDRTSGEGGT
jgi:transcriptional regulator with XRE-family HTH domain